MVKQHVMTLTDDSRCHKMACDITESHIGVYISVTLPVVAVFFLCFCARTVFVPLVSKVITHTYWLQNTSPELKQSWYFIWEQFPSTGELFKSLTLTLNLKINNKNKGNRKWVEKWPHPKDYLMIIFTHDTVFQTLCVLINTTFM